MSIHELVQSAMEAEDISAYKISMETGLNQGLLSRFLRGKSPLSLRALTLVLDTLGYELTIRKKENSTATSCKAGELNAGVRN